MSWRRHSRVRSTRDSDLEVSATVLPSGGPLICRVSGRDAQMARRRVLSQFAVQHPARARRPDRLKVPVHVPDPRRAIYGE